MLARMLVALLLSQGRDARLSAFAVTAGVVVMIGAATRIIVDVTKTFVLVFDAVWWPACGILSRMSVASNSGEAGDWKCS